jgi:hypothetical protein
MDRVSQLRAEWAILGSHKQETENTGTRRAGTVTVKIHSVSALCLVPEGAAPRPLPIRPCTALT